ncbi:zinc finger MYM-type protein 1-like, partial [Aphis craccivora]
MTHNRGSLFNIDKDALKCELKVAKNNSISGTNIETKTQSQLLKSIIQQEVYPNIAFAIPISSAMCERSFS